MIFAEPSIEALNIRVSIADARLEVGGAAAVK
jgi:hypothetical protein